MNISLQFPNFPFCIQESSQRNTKLSGQQLQFNVFPLLSCALAASVSQFSRRKALKQKIHSGSIQPQPSNFNCLQGPAQSHRNEEFASLTEKMAPNKNDPSEVPTPENQSFSQNFVEIEKAQGDERDFLLKWNFQQMGDQIYKNQVECPKLSMAIEEIRAKKRRLEERHVSNWNEQLSKNKAKAKETRSRQVRQLFN